MSSATNNLLLWTLMSVSIAMNVVGGVFTDIWPLAIMAPLVTLSLVAFAFGHGSATYRPRGMIVFAVICFVVSNVVEHVGITTGVPFGNYRYSDAVGPKLFLVPVIIGPTYFGMGYLSWMLARAILGLTERRCPSHAAVTLPVIASFVLVSWNLSCDPLFSTIRQGWIWEDGGAFFGVPATNFVGWSITAYVIFQVFALYLRQRENGLLGTWHEAKAYWLQPIVIYGTVPIVLILAASTTSSTEFITDQAGASWRISVIYAASALVSTFTMGAFSAIGLVKVLEGPGPRS